jgi:predicted amidophosphoribosyltransferase
MAQHVSCRNRGSDLVGDCADCQKSFDSARSYCGNCWKVVTNAAFLGKNSPHVIGKCKERFSIPATIYQRTVDRGCKHPSTYYTARWLAKQASRTPETHARLIELLEEQIRLRRQLLGLLAA